MNSVMYHSDKLVFYLAQCSADNIKVFSPDINKSQMYFSVQGNDIVFGLLAIKSIGTGLIKKIISEREKNGIFTSFEDFCTRLNGNEFNKKAVLNLIKSGAMDCFPQNRHELIENFEKVIDSVRHDLSDHMEGQMNLFGECETKSSVTYDYTEFDEYDDITLLNMEREVVGIFISGNPLDKYSWISDLMHCSYIATLENISDNQKVQLLCEITNIKLHITKNKEKMCFIVCEDKTGSVDAVIFPNLFRAVSDVLKENNIVYITGNISVKDDGISIIARTVSSMEDTERIIKNGKFCIKLDDNNVSNLNSIINVTKKYIGNTELVFFLNKTRKFIKMKAQTTIDPCKNLVDELSKVIPVKNIGWIE